MSAAARRFNVLQLIAVTTSVAAGLALFYIVSAPPLGSLGLVEASVPAAVLLVGLWFCRGTFSTRMGLYAFVGAALAVVFCLRWLRASDTMFGHYSGPPQWVVVALAGAGVSVAACLLWFATSGSESREAPFVLGRLPVAGSLGMGTVTAASILVLLVGSTGLTNFELKANHYIEQRLLHQRMSVAQWAERLSQRDLPRRREMASRMASHFLMPDDLRVIPTLAKLLDEPDVEIRRHVAITLAKVVDDAWGSGKLASNRLDAEAKAAIMGGLNDPDDIVRTRLNEALNHLDPAAAAGSRGAPGSLPYDRPVHP
jgi:hypothetical protein